MLNQPRTAAEWMDEVDRRDARVNRLRRRLAQTPTGPEAVKVLDELKVAEHRARRARKHVGIAPRVTTEVSS